MYLSHTETVEGTLTLTFYLRFSLIETIEGTLTLAFYLSFSLIGTIEGALTGTSISFKIRVEYRLTLTLYLSHTNN